MWSRSPMFWWEGYHHHHHHRLHRFHKMVLNCSSTGPTCRQRRRAAPDCGPELPVIRTRNSTLGCTIRRERTTTATGQGISKWQREQISRFHLFLFIFWSFARDDGSWWCWYCTLCYATDPDHRVSTVWHLFAVVVWFLQDDFAQQLSTTNAEVESKFAHQQEVIDALTVKLDELTEALQFETAQRKQAEVRFSWHIMHLGLLRLGPFQYLCQW